MRNNFTLAKSVFLIALTLSIFGYGLTQSLFSDTERSNSGLFLVGTLDMAVGTANGTSAENLVVTDFGTADSIAGGKTWEINNVGSLPGELEFAIENIVDRENGCNEPEALVDSTCGNPGDGEGELGPIIATTVAITQNNQTKQVISSNLNPINLQTYADQWVANAGKIIIPPQESVTVTLNWSAENSEFANEVQSDQVSFDIVFQLSQVDYN